jgi:DNA ligase (NAD+)
LVDLGDEPIKAFSNKAGEPNISAYGLVFKLELAKESELWRLLTALSIRLIGPEVAKPLSERFDSLEAVFQAETSEIASIQGVGEAAAKSIRDWFTAAENKAIISSWADSGVRPRVEKITIVEREGLAGKNVLVTGSLSNFDRDQVKSALVRAGARVASGPSSTVDLVVLGEKPGPAKVAKINSLGLTVINEQELMALLGDM